MKKQMLCVFLVLAVGLFLVVPFAGAEEPVREKVRIPILTLPLGAGLYEWWATVERLFEANHPWLRVAVQETPGFIYNLKEMAANMKRWKNTAFGSSLTVLVAAHNGIEPFFDKRIPSKDWKFLYPTEGCATATWMWVTFDPEIKTMKDFEGKRLGLGLRGQINWGFWPTVALQAMGVKANLEYLGPIPAIEALQDGRVAVAQCNVALAPKETGLPPRVHQILDLLKVSKKKFHYVSYDNNWIELLEKQKGYRLAKEVKIPAGTLPQQEKQVIGIQSCPDAWAVHETFPEEIAYEFTKFMIQHGSKLAKYSDMGNYFNLSGVAMSGFGFNQENTHPGAIRAYKGAGIWK
jgi:TRAP-type uncharacterized transport system substrate-binding protein